MFRRLVQTTGLISILTMVVTAVGALRELAVANAFGVSRLIDAFVIAQILPSLLVQLIAGSLAAALVPALVRADGPATSAETKRWVGSVLALAFCVLVALTVACFFAARPLMGFLGPGFDDATMDLTTHLFRWLLPLILLQGMVTVWSGVAHSVQRFALVAVAPTLRPLLTLLLLLLFGDRFGVTILVIGLVAGSLLEILLVGGFLFRQGLPVLPRWHGFHPAIRRILTQFWPMLASGSVFTGMLVVDQVIASLLGPGAVSALSYGNKVIVVILGLTALPLGTAALPLIAGHASRSESQTLTRDLKRWIRAAFIAGLPIAAIVYFLADSMIRLLFERGAFTPADTDLVGRILAIYALQIPFALVSTLIIRTLTALQAARQVFVIALLGFMLNLAGDLILMRFFGLAGIALATSLTMAISAGVSAWLVYRVIGRDAPRHPALS
ncbi:MAG: murein biosynthesis integral membrane protein MurJ [Alphaproteobacteria bacterium]